MSCREIREKLDTFVEGELNAIDEAAVAEHLSLCEACRKEAEASAQLTSMLYQLPREPAAADLAVRILAAVEARQQTARVWVPRLVLIAASSLVAGMVAAWLALQTAVAAQSSGVLDFLSLLTSRPETLVSYPQDAFYALIESVPMTELLLTLGMILATLLLLRQVLSDLTPMRLPGGLDDRVVRG